ncbi:MAG: NADH-quinone oxidoreductase subunit C [Candidatus Heimdallarchaeota archaeon]
MKSKYTQIVAMQMQSILDRLMKALGDAFLDGEIRQPTRIWITIKKEDICSVVKVLKDDFGIYRLVMITGLETPYHFELLYHFERQNELQLTELITIKIQVSREDPSVESLVNIMPSALIYEAELRDHLGIEPKGHPTHTKQIVGGKTSLTGYPLQKRDPTAKLRETEEN